MPAAPGEAKGVPSPILSGSYLGTSRNSRRRQKDLTKHSESIKAIGRPQEVGAGDLREGDS